MRAYLWISVLALTACNTPFESVTLPSKEDVPAPAEAVEVGAPLSAPTSVDLDAVPAVENSLYVSIDDVELTAPAEPNVPSDDVLSVAGDALAEIDAEASTAAPLIEMEPAQTATTQAQETQTPASQATGNNDCPEGAPYLYKGTMYCGNFMGNK